MARHRSKVKWFNNARGYGFLEPVEGCTGDIIVHQKEIKREWPGEYVRLEEGDRLDFTLVQTDKGARALEVQRV